MGLVSSYISTLVYLYVHDYIMESMVVFSLQSFQPWARSQAPPFTATKSKVLLVAEQGEPMLLGQGYLGMTLFQPLIEVPVTGYL